MTSPFCICFMFCYLTKAAMRDGAYCQFARAELVHNHNERVGVMRLRRTSTLLTLALATIAR